MESNSVKQLFIDLVCYIPLAPQSQWEVHGNLSFEFLEEFNGYLNLALTQLITTAYHGLKTTYS